MSASPPPVANPGLAETAPWRSTKRDILLFPMRLRHLRQTPVITHTDCSFSYQGKGGVRHSPGILALSKLLNQTSGGPGLHLQFSSLHCRPPPSLQTPPGHRDFLRAKKCVRVYDYFFLKGSLRQEVHAPLLGWQVWRRKLPLIFYFDTKNGLKNEKKRNDPKSAMKRVRRSLGPSLAAKNIAPAHLEICFTAQNWHKSIFLGGSFFTYSSSFFAYSWSFFADSPLRPLLDALSHCKKKSSNCK